MSKWIIITSISILIFVQGCKSKSGESNGSETQTNEPNSPLTQTKEPAPIETWGKDVNGLRIRIEFVPDEKSYFIGAQIGVLLHVQNVSNDIIQVARVQGQSDPGYWTIEDSEKRKIIVYSARWDGARRIERKVLNPGDEEVFELDKLTFGTYGNIRADIKEPGTYTARYTYRFIRRDEKDWTGTIESDEYKLVITL